MKRQEGEREYRSKRESMRARMEPSLAVRRQRPPLGLMPATET